MISGSWFDPRSSRARAAEIDFEVPGVLRVRFGDGEAERLVPLVDVRFSERLGTVPRRLQFDDGATFETADNDAIDAALSGYGRKPGLVHWLEQRWPVAIVSLLAVAVIAVLFVRYGVPAMAAYAARVLPPAADRALGAQTLEILDRTMLAPTRLPAARQRVLEQRFAAMTRGLADAHDYRLEFRYAPGVGPNAFALPSGIIVITDELVALAQHDDELVTVLAHEIGHVRGRHALRQLLQSAGVSAMTFAILGDVSSISAIASAVPALIEAKHSRDFEREADAFAQRWMRENGIPRHRFDDLLCRIEAEAGSGGPGGMAQYLSSHPATEERAQCEAEESAAR